MSSTATTTTSAVDALRAHGVSSHVARRIASAATPDLIGAWCDYAQQAPRPMTPGPLIAAIRSGDQPPPSPPAGRTLDSRDQARYGQQIRSWLRAKVPAACPAGEPHPAAVATVIRLHARYGRGTITAKAHGAVILAAVRAAEAQP